MMEATALETEYTSIEMRCPSCSALWEAPAARFVNVKTDPDARLGILLGTMHHTHCPACRESRPVEVIFDYYDPDRRLIVQVRPEWEYAAGGGDDWYWARYEDLVEKYATVDVQVDVVFGFAQMTEKYLGGAEGVAAARREWEERRARADAAPGAGTAAAEQADAALSEEPAEDGE